MNITLLARLLARLRICASVVRVAMARGSGVKIADSCTIAASTDLALGFSKPRRGQLHIAERCSVFRGAVLHPYGNLIDIGRDTVIGEYVIIYGHGGVEIGPECLIGMHSRILSSNHSLPPLGTAIRTQPDVLKPTRLGRDVWLGAGVTVLGGVTIGEGCVVGAGAVVTTDLPPGSIAAGVPARVIGHRPSR